MFRKSLMKEKMAKKKTLKLKGLGKKGGFENGLLDPNLLQQYTDGQCKTIGFFIASPGADNVEIGIWYLNLISKWAVTELATGRKFSTPLRMISKNY